MFFVLSFEVDLTVAGSK